MTITGHLGASLTHGEDYLSSILLGNKEVYTPKKSGVLLTELRGNSELSEIQKDKLSLEIRGIFAHKCYQCHSENKQKGKLVLEYNCLDNDENLYVCQWNANKTYPIKLERV